MLEEILIRWREATREEGLQPDRQKAGKRPTGGSGVRIPKEACRRANLGLPIVLFNSMVKRLAAAQGGPESRPLGLRGSSMETTSTDQQFVANRSYVPTQEEIEALHRDIEKFILNKAYRLGWSDGARYTRRRAQLSGMRKILLESMRYRFGSVSSQLRHRVSRISSPERLLKLAGQVLTAETLEDLAL
jgi:hypothetical protein